MAFIAKNLTQQFRPESAIIASDELVRFYRSALESGVKVEKDTVAPHSDGQVMTQRQITQSIDFEFESDVTIRQCSITHGYSASYLNVRKG